MRTVRLDRPRVQRGAHEDRYGDRLVRRSGGPNEGGPLVCAHFPDPRSDSCPRVGFSGVSNHFSRRGIEDMTRLRASALDEKWDGAAVADEQLGVDPTVRSTSLPNRALSSSATSTAHGLSMIRNGSHANPRHGPETSLVPPLKLRRGTSDDRRQAGGMPRGNRSCIPLSWATLFGGRRAPREPLPVRDRVSR